MPQQLGQQVHAEVTAETQIEERQIKAPVLDQSPGSRRGAGFRHTMPHRFQRRAQRPPQAGLVIDDQ